CGPTRTPWRAPSVSLPRDRSVAGPERQARAGGARRLGWRPHGGRPRAIGADLCPGRERGGVPCGSDREIAGVPRRAEPARGAGHRERRQSRRRAQDRGADRGADRSSRRRIRRQRTGFAIGGVAPVAHAEPLTILIDEDLLQWSEIWAAAGHPNTVFKLTPADLVSLTGGRVAPVKS